MKILIALEDPAVAQKLKSQLSREDHEVVFAKDGSEAKSLMLVEGAPQIAILGRNSAQMDGLKICQELRRHEDMSYIYLLLVTDPANKSRDIRDGIVAGVDDFLTWPPDADELQARLYVARRMLALQQDITYAQDALRFQSSHDLLTGLWNRSAILDILGRELARVRREKTPVGVLALQVDHFKEINEKYGSKIGDAVLRGIARKTRASVRPYDSIGRFGADTFLIVTPGANPTAAQGLAERLRSAVAADSVDITEWGKNMPADKSKLAVTTSLGAATSECHSSIESLVRAAETALERAIKSGANRVELATELPPVSPSS